MQVIILIYRITGASQVPNMYMIIRLLVSSYLFLNGYGHFHFYWKQQQLQQQQLQQQQQQLQDKVIVSKSYGLIRFVTVSREYQSYF